MGVGEREYASEWELLSGSRYHSGNVGERELLSASRDNSDVGE